MSIEEKKLTCDKPIGVICEDKDCPCKFPEIKAEISFDQVEETLISFFKNL